MAMATPMCPSRSVPYERNSIWYCFPWKNFSNLSAQSLQTSCNVITAPLSASAVSLLRTFRRRLSSSKSSGRFQMYCFSSTKFGERRFQVTTATSPSRRGGFRPEARRLLALEAGPGLGLLFPPKPPRRRLTLETAVADTDTCRCFDTPHETPASAAVQSPNFHLVSDDFSLESAACQNPPGRTNCAAGTVTTGASCTVDGCEEGEVVQSARGAMLILQW
mmetsp:Transcript_64866/g.120679  ORF Transcript_64866/g.120679 Transcript_64866/m.120679 type:complete len:220 (+) Transcript_64866:833-1492(+)